MNKISLYSIIVILIGYIFIIYIKNITNIATYSNMSSIVFDGSHSEGKMENIPEYPFMRRIKNEDDVRRAFNRIKEYTINLVYNVPYTIYNIPNINKVSMLYKNVNNNFPGGQWALIVIGPDEYLESTWLADWFNEDCRIVAKRYDEELSPLDYWRKNYKTIFNASHIDDFNTNDPIQLMTLNSHLYDTIAGCNNFKPTLMVGFIKMFHAKSVLDFSAGWGSRLLSALATNVRYVGVDPNECLFPGYTKMIDMFAVDPTKYTMICSPFETSTLPDERFDMVFTSPPYYNLEDYGREYPALDIWFNDFLIFSINKAIQYLTVGGHFIININNIRNHEDYVIRMNRYIDELPHMKRLGLISYTKGIINTKHSQKKVISPQPIWIWKKISN